MEPVYTLLLLTAVPCLVLCGHVPAPVNIEMKSHHFIHLLTWEAGAGSPAGVYYRVTYRSYKDNWQTVESCVQVRYPLLCNLTDVFSELNEMYYINVTAISGKYTSTPQSYTPFRPISDTEPEPPSLRLSPCNDSLCVYLQSPSPRLQEIYENFRYTLNVTNEKGVHVMLNTRGLETMKLKVVPGLLYCVSVNINDRKPTDKAVCSAKPAAANKMDAVIPGVLCLIMMVVVAFVFLLILQRPVKINQPFVLESFSPPYKEQLLSPAVEWLNFDLIVIDMHKNVQVNEAAEKEEEEVMYERLGCCQDASCEVVLKKNSSSLAGFFKSQLECNYTLGTEKYTCRDSNIPHRQATSPQNESPIFTTHSLALKIPTPQLKKNDSALLWSTSGGHRQEQEEDSDDVNFFSLILGGQSVVQRELAEKEEQIENVKPEENLFVLETREPSPDVQPSFSKSTSLHILYSEDEGEEDTGDFSGYMVRN